MSFDAWWKTTGLGELFRTTAKEAWDLATKQTKLSTKRRIRRQLLKEAEGSKHLAWYHPNESLKELAYRICGKK